MSFRAFFSPTGEELSNRPQSRLQISSYMFYGFLVLGFAMRIATLFSVASVIDSDRAVVYLMAEHFSRGEFTTFFWGQNYGGTLLQATAAAAMLFFGLHIEVLEIVAALFFCGATLVFRAIAVRAFGQFVGDVAGVIFWFPGAFLLYLSVSDYFNGPTLLFGLLAMWLALCSTARSGYLRWGFVGLFAGLAFWQSAVGGALAFPAVIWLFWRHRSLPHYAAASLGAIVGALPWLIAAVNAGAPVVRPNGSGVVHLPSYVTLFTRLLPYAVRPLLPVPVQRSIGFLAVALLVMLATIAVRQRNRWAGALVASMVLCIVIVVVGSGILLAADSARYSLYLLPYISISLAWLLSRARAVGYVAIGLVPLVTLSVLLPATGYFNMSTAQRYGPGMSQIETYLLRHRVEAAYGDYWLAYRFTAATQEKVTMAAMTNDRYAPYVKNAEGKAPMVIVVYADRSNDLLLAHSRSQRKHERQVIAGYAIYTFDKWFDPFPKGASTWHLF